MTRFRHYRLSIALAMLCTVGGTSRAVEDGVLLIWINGDKAYRALQEIGNRFERETGVPVLVEHPVDLTTKYGPAALGGGGPDIVIWAHDRLGGWAQSGLIQPVPLSDDYMARFHPKAWEGVTYGGKVYGYPLTMEAITLLYNKKYITEPPKTLHETYKMAEQNTRRDWLPILWAYDNPYFTFPFLAGAGGYVYGQNETGDYNILDVGVNTSGAVAALEQIVDMISKGIMPRSATYDVMAAKMAKGELGMMVSGPWAWNELTSAGIDFGVGIIPGLDGPAKPFVGVLTAMVDAKTPNVELIKLFMEDYVLTTQGLMAMNADTFSGPPALLAAYEAMRAEDPRMKASMDNVEVGLLMPNVPQMGVFWSSVESALRTVTAGQSEAKAALDHAARIMRTENEKAVKGEQ